MANGMAGTRQVVVVTDSTSYLPAGLADQLGVRVVALQVRLGERTGLEGVDVSPADVTAALRSRTAVSTSRPSTAEFVKVYRQALDSGAEAVVSLHLSAELSGTCDSARLAAAEFGDSQIRVVDSRSAGMALGFGVLAAARQAADGAEAEAVQRRAQQVLEGTKALFYVDSLEWLYRGGRIGAAAARFGTALSMKPLLHLAQGRIVPLEKVRTSSKAIARLVQLTVAAAGDQPVDIAVQHLAAPERAADLAGRLRSALPNLRELYESEVGAAVGAHVGPGLLGSVVSACS